jgi:hypothetical protein
VVKQLVAADALVEHHEPVQAGLLQACANRSGHWLKRAAACGGAFRDGIAQRHDYLGTIIALHHHCREHVLLVAQPHAVGDAVRLPSATRSSVRRTAGRAAGNRHSR